MRLIVYTDGACRGGVAVGGAGAAAYHKGRLVAEASVHLAECTCNVAEYHGVLLGIELARRLGATELLVRADSKLVLNQMTGRWAAKHARMRRMLMTAQRAARGFGGKIEYRWISREHNRVADRLAKRASRTAKPPGYRIRILGSSGVRSEPELKAEVALPSR